MEKETHSYKDLVVWQKLVELVTKIYKLVGSFPREEIYSLTSQIKRAAVSIPSNIAEGSRRGSRKEFTQFLRIAYGSGAELETQLEIAKHLSFGVKEDYNTVENLLLEVMKMLNKMTTNYKLRTNNYEIPSPTIS